MLWFILIVVFVGTVTVPVPCEAAIKGLTYVQQIDDMFDEFLAAGDNVKVVYFCRGIWRSYVFFYIFGRLHTALSSCTHLARVSRIFSYAVSREPTVGRTRGPTVDRTPSEGERVKGNWLLISRISIFGPWQYVHCACQLWQCLKFINWCYTHGQPCA